MEMICNCVSDSIFYEVAVLKDYNCISTAYIQYYKNNQIFESGSMGHSCVQSPEAPPKKITQVSVSLATPISLMIHFLEVVSISDRGPVAPPLKAREVWLSVSPVKGGAGTAQKCSISPASVH